MTIPKKWNISRSRSNPQFLEPHAVSIERRLEALRKWKAAGIPCGIQLTPIIPFVTDIDEAIEAMVKTAVEIGMDYFVFSVLRLRGEVVRGYYFQALKTRQKDPFEKTIQLYGSRTYPPDGYVKSLFKKVKFYREKWGFQNHWREFFSDKPLSLF